MKKILIVDDEYLIRYALSTVLHDSSTEVISVADGKTALETIKNQHVDLCFLDIHLPDMNGLDIMNTFREISPWTRIIIMTGSVITGTMMSSIREKAHCLVSKPFDLEEVISVVNRLLARDRTQRREKGYSGSNEESSIQWMGES